MQAALQRMEPAPEDELALARAEILAGEGAAAAGRLQALIEQRGPSTALVYWLSAAQGAAGDLAAQAETLALARTVHGLELMQELGADLGLLQADPAYAGELATQFYGAKLMGSASAAFAETALKPDSALAQLISYGLSLQHQGRIEEAVTVFTIAVERAPASVQAQEFLLYALFFADDGVRRHAEEVRLWASRHVAPLDPARPPFANGRDSERRLRIGYVAPSFVGTQVRQFFLPVLEAHDASRFEVLLYPRDAAAEPALPVAGVRGIGGLSDPEAAALIRQDGVDVLIDLWGHTANGRLGVFALKPAPVQVAWVNYVQTTGLEAIDWVIHADCMDAPGTEGLFAEKIWRIGPIMAPFRPDPRPPLAPTPALRNGYVTFGSFNHPARLSDPTIAAWARILKGRPGSRLVLKYGYFTDPVLQAATAMRFAAHGVEPHRIEFRGHTHGPDYLAEFADIDLALDPSPCPGGTTSSDAIANGVPVLTLRGPDFYSRIGIVCVEPLGLHELVAESWDDYVARAVGLTADPLALDALRRRVRARFETSPARDEAGFTRRLEDALCSMFAQWCARG